MQNKPRLQKYGTCRSGIFRPKYPEKYVGDPNNIIFRSNLENRFYKLFDENPKILKWGSEEMHVKYLSSLDEEKRVRRYFPDLVLQVRTNNGDTKVYMIEIKPKSQCYQPKQRKNTKRYIKEMQTWQLNQDKWKAATAFCQKNGMTFWVLHEEHLKSL